VAQSLTFCYYADDASAKGKGALYLTDGTKIGETEEITLGSGSPAVKTVNFLDPKPNLVAGTVYVICAGGMNTPNKAGYLNYSGSGTSKYCSITYPTFPDSVTWTSSSRNYLIYCTYTPSGGGATIERSAGESLGSVSDSVTRMLTARRSVSELSAGTHNDDFNDNTIDAAFWDKWYYPSNANDVNETNQRLECTCDNDGDMLGLVTKIPYDLTEATIQISIPIAPVVHAQHIWLLKTIWKDSQGMRFPESYPSLYERGYELYKSPVYNCTRVRKNNDGSAFNLIHDGAWQSSTGTLKIVISSGVIKFYDDDVLIYSENFDSAIPTTLYVAITGYATGTYLGMAYFDDYLFSYGVSATVSDSVSCNLRRVVAVSEGLGAPSDMVARAFSAYRTVSEASISVSDAVVASKGGLYEASIFEASIGVSDFTTRILWAFRTVSEVSISASDSVSPSLLKSVAVSEVTINVADSASHLFYRGRAVSESLGTVFDGVSVNVRYVITVAEPSIAVSDVVSAGIFGKVKATKLFLVIGDLAIQLSG
jgi:hypothetical protein